MSILNPPGLTRSQANDRQKQYGEARGYRDVQLGSISWADAYPSPLLLPLCARAGRTLWVTECDLLVYTAISSSATDYWTFTLRRYRSSKLPPTFTGVMTGTDIVVHQTIDQAQGGIGMGAAQPWPMSFRSWRKTDATLYADDHLALYVVATGQPATLDRLCVTWGYTEVES